MTIVIITQPAWESLPVTKCDSDRPQRHGITASRGELSGSTRPIFNRRPSHASCNRGGGTARHISCVQSMFRKPFRWPPACGRVLWRPRRSMRYQGRVGKLLTYSLVDADFTRGWRMPRRCRGCWQCMDRQSLILFFDRGSWEPGFSLWRCR